MIFHVMAGCPAFHVLAAQKGVDARGKPAHDVNDRD
jgi:hypothetical protein